MKQPSSEFVTERLQLAIFLHATNKLKFLRCDPNGGDKVFFAFADPEGNGNELELEYERGAAVPATSLFASQKFLRRQMSDVKNNNTRKLGDSYGYRKC